MTDRIPLGDLTADALDALYDRLAELEKDAATTAEIMEKADADLDGIIETGRYFRHLAEHQRQWGEQHRDRANRYRARTDAVKAELHALNSETRGLNPVALAGRRDAVARIRDALSTITHETQVPDDPRVTELEQQLADATGELTEAREHNDRTCEAVAARDQAEAAIERVLEALEAAKCRGATGMQFYTAGIAALDEPQQPATTEA